MRNVLLIIFISLAISACDEVVEPDVIYTKYMFRFEYRDSVVHTGKIWIDTSGYIYASALGLEIFNDSMAESYIGQIREPNMEVKYRKDEIYAYRRITYIGWTSIQTEYK